MLGQNPPNICLQQIAALGSIRMSWITIVPIVFFTLFFLNSAIVVFWLRKKMKFPKPKTKRFFDRRLTKTGYLVNGLMIIALLFGFAAQELAPSSLLAKIITENGKIIYMAWCLMITTIFGIALGMLGYPLEQK